MVKRISTVDVKNRKGQEPLVMLTAYSYPFAKQLDACCDILLVGDSLGMVLYGMDSPLQVSLEMMMAHGKAVVRGSEKACVIVDMPFGSYQESPEQAFRNGARLLAETGAQAVKLEGGVAMAETIRFLTERGVAVMGHIGLTPQSLNTMGGFKAQGKGQQAQQQLIADAKAAAEAGAFAIVLEGVFADGVDAIVSAVDVPVIGIGATAACDGQVLVTEDMAGFGGSEYLPKFVKQYGQLGTALREAAEAYAEEVRARQFPSEAYTYRSAAQNLKVAG
jgi:3-methyl-2-oxobutanoate hydroxymethyltransferase